MVLVPMLSIIDKGECFYLLKNKWGQSFLFLNSQLLNSSYTEQALEKNSPNISWQNYLSAFSYLYRYRLHRDEIFRSKYPTCHLIDFKCLRNLMSGWPTLCKVFYRWEYLNCGRIPDFYFPLWHWKSIFKNKFCLIHVKIKMVNAHCLNRCRQAWTK